VAARRPQTVEPTSPLVLSPTSTTPALGPRTTVVFWNLAGEGKTYTLQGCSVAKVVIGPSLIAPSGPCERREPRPLMLVSTDAHPSLSVHFDSR
jgi:hypothetical protein